MIEHVGSDDEDIARYGDPTSRGALSSTVGKGVKQRPRQYGGHSSLEQDMLVALEECYAQEAQELMAGNGRTAESLRQHIQLDTTSNTETGMRMKLGDWVMFTTIVYKAAIGVQSCVWPPTQEDWLLFLTEARPLVSSYTCFRCVIGNVCRVGVQYWGGKLGLPLREVDPRVLYEALHSSAMRTLKRELGMNMEQVLPITMHESRNAPHFADTESIRAVAACAAFTMGCLLGGRRARTLTAVRLDDVTLTAEICYIHGQQVLVPHMRVRFTDEKFDDIQGCRHSRDAPHQTGYSKQQWWSPAYWVYRLLVLRGVFTVFDPITSAAAGELLVVREECMPYFLFCEVRHSFWLDCAPSSVGTISEWNKSLLLRMKSPARGFSAHRSGFVTRACILDLMHNEGRDLSPGTLEVIVRWGGWQAVTGARTVMRVYARNVLDDHVDPYALSLGSRMTAEDWKLKQQQYLGTELWPTEPIVDRGRGRLPLQFRINVWRCAAWQQYLTSLNVASDLMTVANAHVEVMPVRRFREGRRAMNVMQQTMPDTHMVSDLSVMRGKATAVWQDCVQQCKACAWASFQTTRHCESFTGKGFSFLDMLAELHIGNVPLYGGLQNNSFEAFPLWDQQGIYVWR